MNDLVWIERGAEGWYLRARRTAENPAGDVLVLHRFRSLHDDDSVAEIDEAVAAWGWRRVGILYEDEMGAYQVPVSPDGP